ncbi:hypothetical protein [Pseudopedobacter beijingensis]|uniref:Uncharacterized protein n=1 Tax=Pseudopedobacter beijingensis TaxID=1207056 RepID=A0ABW4IC35_9SPHI
MLKKTFLVLKLAILVILVGVVFYVFESYLGKYILGAGLMMLAFATVLYIIFLFRRYGDKTPVD